MRILALDLGKNMTAAYLLDRDRQEHSHTTVRTSPTSLHDLMVDVAPDRVDLPPSTRSKVTFRNRTPKVSR